MKELSYQLCYIKNNWAYFTSVPLNLQWGDRWDETAYEHNSGEPYLHHKVDEEHQVIKIAWEGKFNPPCHDYINSHWSVEHINQKDAPWLTFNDESWTSDNDKIYAGASLKEFVLFIEKNGGSVFVPKNILFGLEASSFKEKKIIELEQVGSKNHQYEGTLCSGENIYIKSKDNLLTIDVNGKSFLSSPVKKEDNILDIVSHFFKIDCPVYYSHEYEHYFI